MDAATPVTWTPDEAATVRADIDWLIAQLYAAHREDVTVAWPEGSKPETFAIAGTERHPADTNRLMEYWAHGEGAAKIRWPEPCAFCRCLEHAGKYFPKNPKGLCANLEKRATGHWPNPQHSHTKHCPC